MSVAKWAGAKAGGREQAHRALDRMATSPTNRGVAVPLPFVDKEAVKAWFSNRDINDAIKAAPIVDVPTDGLHAVQHSVNKDRVRLYIDHPGAVHKGDSNPTTGTPVDHPVVVQRGGVHALWDGHHRVTACILSGKKTVKARLVNLDAGMKEQGEADGHDDTGASAFK